MQKTITVVVAEDHNLVRLGIVHVLSHFDEIKIIGEAENGRVAVEQAAEKDPDVILMDVGMPLLNGLEATRAIKKRYPRTKVIALTGYDDERTIIQILQSGAEGYLLKTANSQELRHAIKAVAEGGTYFTALVKEVTRGNSPEAIRAQGGVLLASEDRLTTREREILQLVAEGKSHQQIAEILHISIRTVDTHRNNILRKLDLHDTASLVLYAVKKGIVLLQK